MPRTVGKTSLAFIFLAAFVMLEEARADYLYPPPAPAFCEDTPPLATSGATGLGGTWSRGGIIGRDGSTGPTFPFLCKQATHAVDAD